MRHTIDFLLPFNINHGIPIYALSIRFIAIIPVLSLISFFGCQVKEDLLFQKHTVRSSKINFGNYITETEEFNITQYIYMYNGGGVAAGDINNDGLADLFFTANQDLDRLYLNRGNLKFEDITEEAGVGGSNESTSWTNGVTMVDINGDGWLDIYVCQLSGFKNISGKNRLYINNGLSIQNRTNGRSEPALSLVEGSTINRQPSFTESAAEYNLDISTYSQHAAFFDYDRDGDLDMYLVNLALHTPDSHKPSSLRNVRDTLSGDRLYQNVNGKFEDVSESAGIFGGSMGYGLAVGLGDINNDGWPDIYVSNDFHENDYLYYNNRDGTFSENLTGSMGHVSTFSMGSDIADFNNDGWLDLITMDMKPADETILKQSSGIDSYELYRYKMKFGYHYQYPRNMLQVNAGPLFGENAVQFSEIGQFAGVDATDWSWGALFADLTNSGNKDLFITTGIPRRPNNLDFTNYTSDEYLKADSTSKLALIDLIPTGELKNVAYENHGSGFNDVSESWGLAHEGFSMGAVPVDLDNDGDLDIVVNNLGEKAIIFENRTTKRYTNNFLKVELIGNTRNRFGIGARVSLETDSGKQIHENFSNKGWLSSVSNGLHFGLGEENLIRKLTVKWPDGTIQELENVDPNTTIKLNQADAQRTDADPEKQVPEKWFKNIRDQSGIDFIHRENFFLDFSVEKLLPHLLSTEGPPLAVGDINSDGLDDFFIGGAKGHRGSVYLQRGDEDFLFTESDTMAFVNDKFCEDVGSVFADIDNDGDLDLYVVSGGSEPDKTVRVQDRIYLNDGVGNFEKSVEALPTALYNGSCVVAADFSDDGFIDFFVGGRSTPTEYGNPAVSKVYINNRDGTFSDRTSGYLQNRGRIGLVTDATWLEDRKELFIVGEWMPVVIYRYDRDSVSSRYLRNTSGWWNTIHADDLDNDGDLDFLVGNEGLNTNISATPSEPLDLYLRDFDGDLSFDPIMAYYKNGQQWVYPGLDELSKQIIGVKRTYRNYEKYATSTFNEVFPQNELALSLHLQVQTLASVWIENKGNGEYTVHELADEAQYSPIYGFTTYDFDGDGFKDIISVGNFHGNQPSMGRCDASFGTYLHNDGSGDFTVVNNRESGFAVFGESRDVKILETGKDHKLILVARNNADTRLFKARIPSKSGD